MGCKVTQTAGGVLGDYGGTVEGSSIVLEAVMWEVVTSAWFGQITSCRFRGTLHLLSRYTSLFFTRPPTPLKYSTRTKNKFQERELLQVSSI